MTPQTSSHHHRSGGGGVQKTQPVFKPDLPEVELFDSLAENQADQMPGGEAPGKSINANQLRKFFGEIKDLYRQFEALSATGSPAEVYMQKIEPRFKMIRSKVAYAQRQRGQGGITKEFADMISSGISQVRPGNYQDFRRFVMHLEAVVGFMYGKGKVS